MAGDAGLEVGSATRSADDAKQQSFQQPLAAEGSGPSSSSLTALELTDRPGSSDAATKQLSGGKTLSMAGGTSQGVNSKHKVQRLPLQQSPGAARCSKRKLPPPKDVLPCPRCGSEDTKFAYYNNRNMKQPRHYCKACQRHWTAGGILRQVAVGAGRRRSRPSTSDASKPTSSGKAGSDYEAGHSPGIPGIAGSLPEPALPQAPIGLQGGRFDSAPGMQSMAAAAAAFPAPGGFGQMPAPFYGMGGFSGGHGVAPWLLPPAAHDISGGAPAMAVLQPGGGSIAQFAPLAQSPWPAYGGYSAGMPNPGFGAWPASVDFRGQMGSGTVAGLPGGGFTANVPSSSIPPLGGIKPTQWTAEPQQASLATAEQRQLQPTAAHANPQMDLQAAAAVWLHGAASSGMPAPPSDGCGGWVGGGAGARRGGSIGSAGSWLSAGTAAVDGLGG